MSEITIYDFINTLIKSWKNIVIIFFFTLLIGICIIFLRSERYTFSLEIDQLSESNFVKYNSFNYDHYLISDRLNKLIDSKSSFDNQKDFEQDFFDREKMLNLFISELTNRETMKQIMSDINIFDINNFNTEMLYDEKLTDFVSNNFKILYPVLSIEEKNLTEEKFRKRHIISFSIAKKFYDDKMFSNLISKTNKTVSHYITTKFEEYILSQEKYINYISDDLKDEITNLRLGYELETQSKLKYLKEQSEIASVLNISENMLFSDLFVQDSKKQKIKLVSDNDPYYLRGYKAINREITLIEERKTIDEYIYSISPLKVKLASLKDQNLLEDLNKSFKKTQIYNEKFSAIDFSLADIKKERIGISNFIILFLSLLAGLIMSLLNILLIIFKNNTH